MGGAVSVATTADMDAEDDDLYQLGDSYGFKRSSMAPILACAASHADVLESVLGGDLYGVISDQSRQRNELHKLFIDDLVFFWLLKVQSSSENEKHKWPIIGDTIIRHLLGGNSSTDLEDVFCLIEPKDDHEEGGADTSSGALEGTISAIKALPLGHDERGGVKAGKECTAVAS
jgi:hypothetical protein